MKSKKQHFLRISTLAGEQTVEWDPAVDTTVDQARETFKRFREKGYLAYWSTESGELKNLMKDFDPEAETITLIPPLMGG